MYSFKIAKKNLQVASRVAEERGAMLGLEVSKCMYTMWCTCTCTSRCDITFYTVLSTSCKVSQTLHLYTDEYSWLYFCLGVHGVHAYTCRLATVSGLMTAVIQRPPELRYDSSGIEATAGLSELHVNVTPTLQFLTDGMLVREMMRDPLLKKYRSILYVDVGCK